MIGLRYLNLGTIEFMQVLEALLVIRLPIYILFKFVLMVLALNLEAKTILVMVQYIDPLAPFYTWSLEIIFKFLHLVNQISIYILTMNIRHLK